MTSRPAYVSHPAYAEYARLMTTPGGFEAAIAKFCEAVGMDAWREAFPESSYAAMIVAGPKTHPDAALDEPGLRRRAPGDLDPASPFFRS